MIEKLPTGYRTVFNLFVVEGYAHKEIAQMLGISENTSKSQLKKARNHLMNNINEEHFMYRTTNQLTFAEFQASGQQADQDSK